MINSRLDNEDRNNLIQPYVLMQSGDNRQKTGLFKSYEHYPKTKKT